MKFALLFVFTAAVAALAQDQVVPAKVAWGDEVPDDGFEILGGQEAQFGHHRYVAGLKRWPSSNTECGGSLIAPNVILTAAPLFECGFGAGEYAAIIKEIKEPSGTDVGIAILDHNITSIQPVAVSFEFVPANVLTWVRGWGNVNPDGPQSQVLKELSLTTWSNTRASAVLFPYRVSDTILTAGGVEGEDSCTGDSGGPLTIEKNGTVHLVGVVSSGFECGELGIPGLYERASAARTFIEPYLPK
ncbi:hypothetical protein H257_15297 [Aphanomyces astaci]|uniref:Peptidase S1 domain-containing protein n=1 Tax=Aphanomyces astaci TaxID=112090 RepID=W4FPT1_APHAT|nr:hypothetical protein H257_15297 [Aphanomyces astaci]ETV68961.1 hypothetical protein H257_15297 [Aphanomyces astaci]|eukprot:XP_009841638.1 hypothetical protein H257_15297 [Aphanomyces astaci]